VPEGGLFLLTAHANKVTSASTVASARPLTASEPEAAPGIITALAASGEWVASANVDGTLVVWHRTEKAARHAVATHRGAIRSLTISSPPRGAGGLPRLLALFHDGDVALWQLPDKPPWALPQPATSLRHGVQLPMRTIGVATHSAGRHIVAVCDDGAVRLLGPTLSRANGAAVELTSSLSTRGAAVLPRARTRRPLLGGSLLSAPRRAVLRAVLQHACIEDAARLAAEADAAADTSADASATASASTDAPTDAPVAPDASDAEVGPLSLQAVDALRVRIDMKPGAGGASPSAAAAAAEAEVTPARKGSSPPPHSSRGAALSAAAGADATAAAWSCVPAAERAALRAARDIPARCLLVARVLGCEAEARLWTLVGHVLRGGLHAGSGAQQDAPQASTAQASAAQASAAGGRSKAAEAAAVAAAAAQAAQAAAVQAAEAAAAAEAEEQQEAEAMAAACGCEPLPASYGLLRPAGAVRVDRLERLAEQLATHPDLYGMQAAAAVAGSGGGGGGGGGDASKEYESARRGALQSVLFGAEERRRGIALLLSSQLEGAAATQDWLMACLVAGFVSPDAQRETVAAAVERLMRADQLELAIPLLCLIGEGEDACSRLQQRGRWEQAAALAKTALDGGARARVLRRWAEQLHTRGETARSVEVLLSLGETQAVIERLLEAADYDAAALLLLALREADARAQRSRGVVSPEPWAHPSAQRVWLEYAAFVSRLQLPWLSAHYCVLAASSSAVPRRPNDTRQADEAAAGATDGATMNAAEAAQLVQQLARLQEEAALRHNQG